MEKEIFEKAFIENLNKNYHIQAKYFDIKYKVFHELNKLVFEINKCLILEFHNASITLTNHLLERLLKLALIYYETGIGSAPVKEWNSIFNEPNNKYSSINFGTSIELCKKHGLINSEEKAFLYDIVRDLMRNGFSHADSSIILNGFPDEVTVFEGSFKNTTELKPMKLNQNSIPFIQAMNIETFAKDTAFDYFDYVIDLIYNIENRLVEKHTK